LQVLRSNSVEGSCVIVCRSIKIGNYADRAIVAIIPTLKSVVNPPIPIVSKRLAISLFSCLLAAATPSIAQAETVMQKITRTGVMTAGTNDNAMPFTYADRNGKLVGYSIDMLELIRDRLQQKLGKKNPNFSLFIPVLLFLPIEG
jgi:hypothetical protein